MRNPAKRGEFSEQRFVIEALKHNWKLAKPLSGSEPYDFIADIRGTGELIRIQVKRSYKDKKNRNVVDLRRSKKGRPTIEFIGIVAVDCEGKFYLIPTDVLYEIKSNICVSEDGPYWGFYENW